MAPPLLVLDKSFAHSAKAERLASLSSDYTLLVPSAFVYEVFDTEARKRRCTITGLGEFRRIHIPMLLAQEMETGSPALSINQSILVFNPNRQSSDWTLSADESPIISRHKENEVNPMVNFWEDVIKEGVLGFSSEELSLARGDDVKFRSICIRLLDPNFIQTVAAKTGYRHAMILDESWLFYRHLQAWLLQGLILCYHYPPGHARSRCDLEHDVQDIEYLTLGLHARGLATRETNDKKHNMGWRFKLLAPDALLVTQ